MKNICNCIGGFSYVSCITDIYSVGKEKQLMFRPVIAMDYLLTISSKHINISWKEGNIGKSELRLRVAFEVQSMGDTYTS